MSITLSALQQQRRDTAANWTSANPTLLAGEIGVETDTGLLKIGDGSTAWTSLDYLPLSFEGYAANGIYNPAANQVALATNGTGRLFIDSSGHVGIGGSPTNDANTTTFEIINSVTARALFKSTGTGGRQYGWYTSTDGQFAAYDYTAASERMRIDSSGRLLVGTTTEGHGNADNLTLADSGSCGLTLRSATDNFGRIYFSDGTSGDAEYRGIIQYDHTNNRMQFAANASTAMTVDSSGNVGIGTTSPGADLYVKQSGTDFTAATQTVAVFQRSSTTGHSAKIAIIAGSLATSDIHFGDNNDEDAGILQYNHTNDSFNFNQNVGIGTSSPIEKIHATGNAILQANNSYIGLQNAAGTSTGYIQGQSSFLAIAGGSGSSNEIAFYPASTEAMRIDSSGNVGIGQSNPSEILHLRNASNPTIRIDNTGATARQGRITVTTDGNMEFRARSNASDGQFIFYGYGAVTDDEYARFDSAGRLLIGTSTSHVVGGNQQPFQVRGTGTSDSRIQLLRESNDAGAGGIHIAKARGTSFEALNDNDQIGIIAFNAADGTDLTHQAANIQCKADGASSSNSVSGKLVFSTNNSSTSTATRMAITRDGYVVIGSQLESEAYNAQTNTKLQVVTTNGGFIALGRDDATVVVGNPLGGLRFLANDPSGYNEVARIVCDADGPHDTDDYPTRLEFYTTADNESTPTERMRIDSSGKIRTPAGSSTRIGVDDQTSAGNGGNLIISAGSGSGSGNTAGNLILATSRGLSAAPTGVIKFGYNDGLNGLDLDGSGEWMRIDGSGSVGVGTSDPTNGGALNGSGRVFTIEGTSGSGARCLALASDGGTGDLALQVVNRTDYSTQRLIIYGDGDIANFNGAYDTISDARFKSNIKPARSQWNDIKGLEIVNYDFQGKERRLLGVVAQQVETVSPGLVVVRPKFNENGEQIDSIKSVHTSVIYMKAVKALQEAMERIEALEAKVAALEAAN